MKLNYFEGVQQCVDYIEQNLTQQITLDDVLAQTYYSYPQMHRVFLDVVGESIGAYIRKRRLSNAARELTETKKRIVEIAMDYGFSSQQTFTRAFTENFGYSPNQYRKQSLTSGLYEPFAMSEGNVDSKPFSVTIEQLPQKFVASCHCFRKNISGRHYEREQDKIVAQSWNRLIQWQMEYEYKKRYGTDKKIPKTSELGRFMVDNGLHIPPNTRYFGFIWPFPENGFDFGYETWAMISDYKAEVMEATSHEDIIIKKNTEGLYAVEDACYGTNSNLNDVWRKMHYWLNDNPNYTYGSHQWLEEHITHAGEGGFHGFRVYLPIQKIEE